MHNITYFRTKLKKKKDLDGIKKTKKYPPDESITKTLLTTVLIK